MDRVSLSFCPSRWKLHWLADTRMKHRSSQPNWIVAPARVESEGPPLQISDLCGWCDARGFETVARTAEYAFRRHEIDIETLTAGGEVCSLHCHFQLGHNSYLHLGEWQAFVHELCDTLGLRISIPDSELLEPKEFSRIVVRTDSWRYYADHFGWPHPPE
jgi:hypothetical protein